jgi:hypothetical protein
VATLDTRGAVDVRYTGDNVTDVFPRMSPADPPGYRPIRWLWDLKVPQDPPYVSATYRSVSQMDPTQMSNRLSSNTPFTKNFPIIGTNFACNTNDDCLDVGRAPGLAPLECYGLQVSNGASAFIPEPGGKRCDIPRVRFGEFCAPGIAQCGNFVPGNAAPVTDPTKPPAMPTPDEQWAYDANNADPKAAIMGGYTCQPNTSQGGYCFLACDSDGSAGSKAAETVMITYKGPDGQKKTDTGKLEFDARCGFLPGYKCLNPSGSGIPTKARVCLRSCDTGKPDTYNDVYCAQGVQAGINEKVQGDIQKGMACNSRGLSGAAGCQWDPAYEPRDPKLNFIPAP